MLPFDTASTVKLSIGDEELFPFFGFDACFPSYSGGSLAPRVVPNGSGVYLPPAERRVEKSMATRRMARVDQIAFAGQMAVVASGMFLV